MCRKHQSIAPLNQALLDLADIVANTNRDDLPKSILALVEPSEDYYTLPLNDLTQNGIQLSEFFEPTASDDVLKLRTNEIVAELQTTPHPKLYANLAMLLTQLGSTSDFQKTLFYSSIGLKFTKATPETTHILLGIKLMSAHKLKAYGLCVDIVDQYSVHLSENPESVNLFSLQTMYLYGLDAILKLNKKLPDIKLSLSLKKEILEAYAHNRKYITKLFEKEHSIFTLQ